jgi:hypothetical protein
MAGFFSSIKDVALTGVVRQFLGSKLEGLGKVAHLKMDTGARRIEVKVELEGEVTPVEIVLTGYEIVEKGGATTITSPAGAFQSSRPWLTKLLNTQLAGRSFEIPAQYARYAKGLVS